MSKIIMVLCGALVIGQVSARAQDASGSTAPQQRKLYVVGASHLDTQWRWTIQNTIDEFVPATFRDLTTQGHFGLAGIQERVELIGGKLAVESALNRGTTVRVVKAHVERQAQNVRLFAEI